MTLDTIGDHSSGNMPNGGTVVVADDDDDIRDLTRFYLQNEGFQIRMFGNGQKCWEYINTHPPDVIVLDIMMPAMSGFEVIKRMRRDANFDETAILILTAHDDRQNSIASIKMGATEYMTKPFDPQELLAWVRRYID